ncbi:MAG: polysaccharide biosynthesis C-terminal domain-containing protein, partial [Candidatus Omnitrophica bacterium]|nr:polysaccharide biosynthesis C-terminal domain-containing protein [Candidatus Omnitrophota bacterium]
PAAAVGYYNAAYMLGSVIILIPKVCGSGVLRPLLSHAVDKGDTDVAVRLPLYMMRLYFLVGIPFITGCIVLSKPILVLIASNDVANAAHFVVPLVAVGILLYGINLFLVNILFVQQKTRVMFGINLVASLLNLILNIIFIYIYRNISVAAITTVITYLISFIMLNQKIKKYITVDYSLTVVSKAIISAFFMGISLYLMRCFLSHTISGIFLLVFINGLFYIACLFILKVFSNKELKYAREYISEFIKR